MRSSVIGLFVVAASGLIVDAHAQAYPVKPIRLVVGYAPGGGADTNARLLGTKLTEYLGQPVIVENRAGAGTNIANEHVAKSAPDGYVLLLNTAAVVINMSLYKNLRYDALRDLTGVSIFSTGPNVLVIHPSLPARNVEQLVAIAKRQPGVLNFSSAGSGSTQHLAGELFKLRARVDIVHVPYNGSSPSLTALLGGEVGLTFVSVPPAIGHIKNGRLRALATTSAQRSPLIPDLPTMKEAGVPGVEVSVWYGVLAPAGIPPEIAAVLANAIRKAAYSEDVKPRLAAQGTEPVGNSPDEFNALLRREAKVWADVVKASAAQAD